MYRVYCDGLLLYHSNLENLKIFNPSIELEVGKTGSFEFTIYPDHARYSLIKKMKSIITVWQDDFLLFRGRPLDEETGWYNEKSFVCEGDLAFLLDSVQRPATFTGTVAEYVAFLVGNHNTDMEQEKQFTVGTVTVDGSLTVELTEYTNTLETVEKTLVEVYGGFLRTRTVDGITYLDYLSEFTELAPQKITFGKNLLDLKRTSKGEEVVSAIIPLGAKLVDENGQETETRLTITSVNNGLDYIINEDAKDDFLTIFRTVIFDEITDPTELLTAGKAYNSDFVNLPETIELTTADLATTDKSITSFHVGTQVVVETKPHGIDHLFLVNKLSLKLHEPDANKMTLGKTVRGFTATVKGISDNQTVILQTIEKTAQKSAEAVYNVEQNLQSAIQVTEENIKSTVAENYYLKDETDSLLSSVSTEIEQTKNSVEIQFNQFSQDIDSVAAGVDAEFEAMHKYIRFEDGNIIQGEEGSPFQKVQSATRESYFDNGKEVAYFSNQMLHVTDGEFTHSLRLGHFAFMPRANGNLSFKKVT